MPFSRRRKTGRRKYPRRKQSSWYSRIGGYVSSGVKTAAMAASALKTANYIAGLINVEKKFYDTSASGAVSSASPGTLALSDVAQGTAYNQRDGNSVKASSLFIRGSVVTNPSLAGSYGQNLRVVVVRDKDNQGSAPSYTDVFETSSIYSPVNHVNGSRFDILHDKLYSCTVQNAVHNFKHYIPLNSHIKWSGTLGNTYKEGHIFMLYTSDTSTVSNQPTVNVYNRVRYVDN